MGLANELMAGVRGDANLVAEFRSIAHQMESEQDAWIADLRAAGVKAAHPDDGWVNRERNSIHFCYPQFNDGAGVGDLVALGWPAWNGRKQTRIVRLTAHDDGWMFGGSWHFEPADLPNTN